MKSFTPFKAAAKGKKKKKKNFYAVRKGVKPGIYTTYEECQKYIKGFSRAEFKGFATKLEAEKYIADGKVQDNVRESVPSDALHVYTDGSLNTNGCWMGIGMYTVLPDGRKARMYSSMCQEFLDEADPAISDGIDDDTIIPSSSLTELFAVFLSVKRLLALGYKKIIIHADNDGVRNWYTGTWAAKKPGIKLLVGAIKHVASECEYFSIAAVDGHSGDVGNDAADRLARMASSGGSEKSDWGKIYFSDK